MFLNLEETNWTHFTSATVRLTAVELRVSEASDSRQTAPIITSATLKAEKV